MTTPVRCALAVFAGLALLAPSGLAQLPDPLAPAAPTSDTAATLTNRSVEESPPAANEPEPGGATIEGDGVVVETDIADEGELAKAMARDAKADADVETDLDRATKPTDLETAVRLQIYLDQKLYGPGFIDGKPGQFTTKAVHAYNRSVGRIPDDWTALIEEANADLGETYATAIVPDVAKQWVNRNLPYKYSAQAREKRMSYRSYLEFMAERYHTSETFLQELNGSAVVNNLKPRSALKVPNVAPFLIETLEAGRKHEAEDVLSARTVVIDTRGRNIFIYEKGEAPSVPGAAVVVSEKDEAFEPQRLIAMFPITPGKVQYIHRGQWAIANCFELPSWRYDKQLLDTGRRTKDPSRVLQIPPGPNVPVGILWSGLTKSGIGIHGTASPRTIGRSLSAGCIRLANWDAARFPTIVRPGARVYVR